MLPLANAGAFVLAALALIVIPGPSVLFVIGRSLALGRRGGLVSVVGNALALLGCIFAVLALISDSTWALIAGTARAWFGRNPRRMSQMIAGGAAMMIGLGGVLVATGNKH